MKHSFAEARRNHISRRQARIVQRRLVRVYRSARRVQNNNRLRYRVGNPAKLLFLFAQFLLRLFQGVDIGAGSIPPDKLSALVTERLDPNVTSSWKDVSGSWTMLTLKPCLTR